MFDLLAVQKESYKKEIEVLRSVNEEKEAKKNNVVVEHQEQLEKIEEEHEIKIVDLHEKKKEELASTIEKNNPESLAKEVAKILNAQYHKNSGS